MAFPTMPQLDPRIMAALMQMYSGQQRPAAFTPNFAPQLTAAPPRSAASPMIPLSPPQQPGAGGGAAAGGGGLGSMNPGQLAALAQMGKGILGMFGQGGAVSAGQGYQGTIGGFSPIFGNGSIAGVPADMSGTY